MVSNKFPCPQRIGGGMGDKCSQAMKQSDTVEVSCYGTLSNRHPEVTRTLLRKVFLEARNTPQGGVPCGFRFKKQRARITIRCAETMMTKSVRASQAAETC